MKKIALPTRNGLIDDHFGHCEFYTIFIVDEEKPHCTHTSASFSTRLWM